MRLIKDLSFRYGKNDFSVEAKTSEQLEKLTNLIDEMGWKSSNNQCETETDYGFSVSYGIHCGSADDFRADFKLAKQKLNSKE
jgi:hypothetical protein